MLLFTLNIYLTLITEYIISCLVSNGFFFDSKKKKNSITMNEKSSVLSLMKVIAIYLILSKQPFFGTVEQQLWNNFSKVT